jgi:predicted phosphodiesterase
LSLPNEISQELRQLIINKNNQYPYLTFRKLAGLLINEGSSNYAQDHLRKIVGVVLQEEIIKNNVRFEENFGEMPLSWYEEPQDYVIPAGIKRIGIINDVHVPFHAPNAVKAAIDYLQDANIDCLLLNGDIADFYSVSRFIRDPKLRNLPLEIDTVNQFLTYLQHNFDNILYKFGNHEVRLDDYVALRSPELNDLEGLSLHEVFHLVQRGIDFIDAKSLIRFGKLTILHGDEIQGGGAVNTARNKLLKSFDNILYGHHHATQYTSQNTINNKIVGSFGVGCLSGLKPRYMPNNNWNYGFAIAERDDVGDFEVHNKKIINNKIL